jgi:holo-[acyl-carrier protein] synthase
MVGLGADVVHIDRFRVALQRTPSLAVRLFTATERAYAETARDPAERFAVRFAAKEAAMKALGVGLGAFPFAAVALVNAEGGAPSLVLTGRAATLADERGVKDWRVSVTHDHHVAFAVVVAL